MDELARASIHIDLNDAEAIAGLRAVDEQFDRTMRDIDRKKATYKIEGDLKPLEKNLAEAKRLADDYEKRVNAQKNKGAQTQMRKKLEQLRLDERAHREAVSNIKEELRLKRAANKEEAQADRARSAAANAQQRQLRATNKMLSEQAKARDKAEANERRMLKLHSDAAAMDRKRTYNAITGTAKEERAVQRLQSRYASLERQLSKLDRQRTKLSTISSRDVSQRVDIKRTDAIAEMAALEAELTAMGRKPIQQHVSLAVDDRHANQLSRALASLSDTAIRIGPITTSLAGLGRGLALLGPIIVGIVGQIGALVAVTGSGLAGALGVGGAALGAFAISLGGVGLLMPSLLNDFKNLNTLQDAYHKQVLKTGAESEKAKTKLKEFQHAMREVPESTRRAFNALDTLKNQWKTFTDNKRIQEAFFSSLEQGLKTINADFGWFQKNTVGAFEAVADGWADWMKGLRGNEAQRILKDLGRAGNESLRPLMGALGALFTAFGRVAQSFARYLPGLMRGFRDWAQGIADATSDSSKLNPVVDRMVGSMRDLGHFIQAAAGWLSALFAPGVDPGRKMLQGWTEGLNDSAAAMRGAKREKIGDFFRDAIDTANKFWGAMKPLVQIFFEWSTIMRPFTDVALTFFGILGDILQVVLAFKPTKGIMQLVFGWFLLSQTIQRIGAFARSIVLIKDAVIAMKAAGGLGAALKTGAISRLFNPFHGGGGLGQPGATPAHPMFTREVGVPGVGKGGGPDVITGGKGGGGGLLNILKTLPRFAKIGGGLAVFAGAMAELIHLSDKAADSNGMEHLDKQIQGLVADRNLSGLRNLKDEFIRARKEGWGGLDKAEPHIDKAIDGITRLENAIANSSITRNFRNLASSGAKSMDAIRNTVRTNMGIIRSRLGSASAEGKAAIAKNFRLAADAVKRRMDESGHHTREGARLIRSYMIRALTSLGLNRAQAESKLDTGTINTQERSPGRAPRNARGGLYQVGGRGQAGLDNVPMNLGGIPAVVANGEQIAVFNRHQQAKFGGVFPGGLEGFFSGAQRPHAFAGGGIVPVPGFPGESAAASVIPQILAVARTYGLTLTDAYGQGHKSPGHTRFGTAADFAGPDAAMTRAAHALAQQGYIVGYDGTGGTQAWPGHGPSSVAGANAHLHVEFGSKGGAIQIAMPKIPNVRSMIPGAPGALVNQGLGIIHSVAQETAERIANEVMALPVSGGGGAVKKVAQGMLSMFGWGQGQFPPLDALWTGESNWNYQARNASSGAFGIPQALPGSKMASAGADWQTNPATQIKWGLGYIKGRYGSPSSALSAWSSRSPHWYAKGGIASMAASVWKRGGKVMQPTMLTGEDGGDHPEFIVGTNPQFRKSNVAALQAAAAKLGVPTARESHHKKPHGLKDSGRAVDKLPYVKEYAKFQKKEDDKQREISIAESRVVEPDTLIKQTGTTPDGEPLYSVDDGAVKKYKGQMNHVAKLYNDLIGKKGKGGIMGQLFDMGHMAMNKLAQYRFNRDQNINRIKKAIAIDEGLLKSKDKHVRKGARKRLEHNRAILGEQRQKKQDAGQKRGEIGEDLHDARFRVQEYDVSRDSLVRDINAVDNRAAEEAVSQNPQPEEAAEPVNPNDLKAAALDAELALAQIGQGIGGKPPRSEKDILTDQAALQQKLINEANALLKDADKSNDLDAYNQLSSAASALQSIQGELAKFDPLKNAKALQTAQREITSTYGNNFKVNSAGAALAGMLSRSAVTSGMIDYSKYRTPGIVPPGVAGDIGSRSGGTVINLNPTFANVPPDPHTWSKSVAFELQAAV